VTNAELILALANVVQVIALAYIAARQAQVKRDLNGASDATIAALADVHRELAAAVPPGGRQRPSQGL
jgi:hypothetical protein